MMHNKNFGQPNAVKVPKMLSLSRDGHLDGHLPKREKEAATWDFFRRERAAETEGHLDSSSYPIEKKEVTRSPMSHNRHYVNLGPVLQGKKRVPGSCPRRAPVRRTAFVFVL